MQKLKVYLDNCCFNRPYDDQTYITIFIETQSKLYIQKLIKEKQLDMVSSYMLEYENNCNPFNNRKDSIAEFLNNAVEFVGTDKSENVKSIASEIMKTGIKAKDAIHLASAIISECDYFITTDYRLLKYLSNKIKIVNPNVFIAEYENLEGKSL